MAGPGVNDLIDTIRQLGGPVATAVADALLVAANPEAVTAALYGAYHELDDVMFTAYMVTETALVRHQHTAAGRLTTWVPLTRVRRVVAEQQDGQPLLVAIELDADQTTLRVGVVEDGAQTGVLQNSGFLITATGPAAAALAAFAAVVGSLAG